MLAETMVAQNIVFGILAVTMVAAAFRLVTTQNVVRSALFLLGALGAVLADAFGDDKIGNITVRRTAEVSDSIFGAYVVPFEVASVLLLAALVGAVALARRD